MIDNIGDCAGNLCKGYAINIGIGFNIDINIGYIIDLDINIDLDIGIAMHISKEGDFVGNLSELVRVCYCTGGQK